MQRVCFLLLSVVVFFQPVRAQRSNLPFDIELEEITFNQWPALHSFAFGEWEGEWIFLCGRSNGLHGFFPFTSFPTSTANHFIWILNPETGEKWSAEVDGLPKPIVSSLLATNPQYAQRSEWLYIFGGYGEDLTTNDFITFPTLTALKLDELVAAVKNGGDISTAIFQLTDERFRVTGGEMHLLDGEFVLFGGHNFEGLYSENGHLFTQTYTDELRLFSIANQNGQLAITGYFDILDSLIFHRRDLNLAPIILPPNGTRGIAAYGGVFKPEKDVPWQSPVYFSRWGLEHDVNFEQKMSQYTCPVLPAYDPRSSTMYSTFFGGISFYYFDERRGELRQDSAVPFIKDITTLIRKPDGSSEEVILPISMPGLLGTNAKLILDKSAAQYSDGIIDLSKIQSRTAVGFIFGGIEALIPNLTPSSASNRFFKIYVTPKASNASDSQNPFSIKIYPNPFAEAVNLDFSGIQKIEKAAIADLTGRSLKFWVNEAAEPLEREVEGFLKHLPKGIYFLDVQGSGKTVRKKLVKIE